MSIELRVNNSTEKEIKDTINKLTEMLGEKLINKMKRKGNDGEDDLKACEDDPQVRDIFILCNKVEKLEKEHRRTKDLMKALVKHLDLNLKITTSFEGEKLEFVKREKAKQTIPELSVDNITNIIKNKIKNENNRKAL